jgi:hypothetical protein
VQLAPRPATVASPSCRRDWQVPLVARPGLARALPHSKLGRHEPLNSSLSERPG